MHRQRMAVTAAACVGMLATFLPWFHAPSGGTLYGTGMPGGYYNLVLFGLILLVGLLGAKEQVLRGGKRGAVLVLAVLIGLIGLLGFRATTAGYQLGIGLGLALASAVAIVVSTFMLRD